MPTIELTKDALIVRLSRLEKFQSLSGDITIPLDDVRGATEDKGATADLGFRAPGTQIPGRLWAGTFIKPDRSAGFVLVKAPLTPVVITVNHKKWSRLVIGVSNPRELVKQINSAIAK